MLGPENPSQKNHMQHAEAGKTALRYADTRRRKRHAAKIKEGERVDHGERPPALGNPEPAHPAIAATSEISAGIGQPDVSAPAGTRLNRSLWKEIRSFEGDIQRPSSSLLRDVCPNAPPPPPQFRLQMQTTQPVREGRLPRVETGESSAGCRFGCRSSKPPAAGRRGLVGQKQRKRAGKRSRAIPHSSLLTSCPPPAAPTPPVVRGTLGRDGADGRDGRIHGREWDVLARNHPNGGTPILHKNDSRCRKPTQTTAPLLFRSANWEPTRVGIE